MPLQAYIINFTVIAVTLGGLLASIQSKSNCHAHYLPIPSLLQACFILFLRRRLMVIRANPVAGMYVSQPSINTMQQLYRQMMEKSQLSKSDLNAGLNAVGFEHLLAVD